MKFHNLRETNKIRKNANINKNECTKCGADFYGRASNGSGMYNILIVATFIDLTFNGDFISFIFYIVFCRSYFFSCILMYAASALSSAKRKPEVANAICVCCDACVNQMCLCVCAFECVYACVYVQHDTRGHVAGLYLPLGAFAAAAA